MNNKHLLLILLTLIPFINYSQDGTLDTSFGTDGYVQTNFYDGNDNAWGVGEQNDGNLIVIGSVENVIETYCTLTRYLPDGEIDASFGSNGTIENTNCSYTKIIIQNDDKFIVSGSTGDDVFLKRFSENGILDTNFGTDGTVIINLNNEFQNLRSTILLDDNKILLIGESGDEIVLIKYLENGTIDTTFGNNGIVNHDIEEDNRVFNGTIQEEGKIVVSAKYDIINTDDSIFFIRFLEDGILDSSFGENGIFEPNISDEFIYTNAIAIDNSNRIVAAFANYDAFNDVYNSSIYRILTDGDIDDSFGNNGFKELGTFSPNSIIIQTNNRILIGGGHPFFEGSYLTMKRILDNGNFDASFTNIFEINIQYSSFLLLNSGKILGLGYTFWFNGFNEDFMLTRYSNDPLGIEDNQIQNFKVFPNPSNGIFNIQHDFLVAETAYLITDVLGKIITTGYLKNDQTEINLTTFKSGVYFLSTSYKTIKLIKN